MADKPDNRNANWREKYLHSLDKQEQQEKKSHSQQELLRRALVRVSVSADGQDDTLDAMLGQLREHIRNARDIKNVLTQLDEAIVSFEQHRINNAQKVRQSISDTLKPLQELELSRPIKKEITQYLAQLPQSCKKVRLYPELLQQLARIQQQALKEVERPKVSFWQKIMGSGPTNKSATEKPPNELARVVMVDRDSERSGEASRSINLVENSGGIKNYASIDAELTALNASPQNSEPQKVRHPVTDLPLDFANKVTHILNQFLMRLESETAIATKAKSIRVDVNDNITADNLLVMLENVRDLAMQAYLLTNHDFAAYLKNVNRELADIYSLVGGAVESEAVLKAASHKMQSGMMQGMKALEQAVETATDLEQLKKQLNSHIGKIRHVFDGYQQTEQQQQQLAGQLDELYKKIKLMETDAEKNRGILEKQRHKALHDPLTGLPNRESYNERSAHEFQRWQRYGRALTIAVFDIDHFKKINDNYGHQAGDRVLKVIGSSIAKSLREVDFFCRFGGEEFVALLPETGIDEAMVALDKIRAAIAHASFNYKNQSISITLSVGATEFKAGDDVEAAFVRADEAMYSAKSGGRNCSRSA